MTVQDAIIIAGGVIGVVISFSMPRILDYHTDLRNIVYQLSRIADALNRKESR